MAVQVAPAQARDFIETMAADNGTAAAFAGKPAVGKDLSLPSARESFDGILAGARLAKSMYAAKYGIPEEVSEEAGKIEKFAASLSDEDLSLLIAPLSNGVERMKDFADALDAELSEGDVRGAIELAGMAVERVSRFDPDLILGSGFAGGSLHKLIEEFLKKFNVSGTAKQQLLSDETPEGEIPTELPEEEALPSDTAEDAALLPDASDTPEFTETAETPLLPDAPALPYLPELPDGAEEDVKADSPEEAEKAEKDDPAAPESETETLASDRAVPNAAFAEIMKAADISRGGGTDDEAVRPDWDKRPDDETALPDWNKRPDDDGLTRLTQKGAKAASVLREQKIERAVPGTKQEDSSDSKPDSFASLFASETRVKQAYAETKAEVPATLPGSTYELRGDNFLGDGVSSVLEFMRNDGINEARIVVEPPALGRVDVSLQASGSGVEAVFKVDNEALKQILQQQLDLLKTSLEAQGIHVSNLAVDIKNREDQRGRSDLYGGKGKVHKSGGIADGGDEDEPRIARIDLERGLLHWVA
ncbi:MAG: flagellar hook-length control protein FliK [Synergistaceae bacterium]|jgi:hypothetical protein|nr:flagellar hook-length control protein FliK [Synergistaceae bacterium]